MRPLVLLILVFASVPSLASQAASSVVTDFGIAWWLTPTSARFDGSRSRIVMTGSFGYLHAVGDRDAFGVTLDPTYYNRRSRYAGIEWLYPQVAAHATLRWQHWLGDDLALRGGLGTPLAGTHLDGDIALPGLSAELGARWKRRVGLVVRMERQRLDYRAFAYPAVPGFTYPLGNMGLTPYALSTARTDWYVGLTTHGWTGLTGFGVTSLLAFFSAIAYTS